MLKPTRTTYVLLFFGLAFIFILILYAQIMMASDPQGRATKDLLIGDGEEWRDGSHLATAYGIAWADLLFWLPVLLAGSVGVLLGRTWGYALWAASGAISVYISIVFWFSEKAFVYPEVGPLAYYTYYWGFFVYWGVAVIAYSVVRLARGAGPPRP